MIALASLPGKLPGVDQTFHRKENINAAGCCWCMKDRRCDVTAAATSRLRSQVLHITNFDRSRLHTAGFCLLGFLCHELMHTCVSTFYEPVSSNWDDPPRGTPRKLGSCCGSDQQVAVLLAHGCAVAATHDRHQLLNAGFHILRV